MSSESAHSVTIVGSTALDTIHTPSGRVEGVVGGSGFYAAAAAALFAPVNLLGAVGDDFPEEQVAFLKEERRVDFAGLESLPGPTFRWEGKYHDDLNHRDTLDVQLGVFERYRPRLPKAAAEARYLLLANIDPPLQKSVLDQVSRPRLVALDTMNLWIANRRSEVEELAGRADLFILNDQEVRQLAGFGGLVEAARQVLRLGARHLVVKKGEHGAMLFSDGEPRFLCPAYPLPKAVDPTGAGDSFAGAMVGYLAATEELNEYNLRLAMVYGTVVASFTVEDFGLRRLKTLTPDQVDERYRHLRRLCEF